MVKPAPPPPPEVKRTIRRKGTGKGYLSKLPPVSFRLREDQRKELEALAETRSTTIADLARGWVLDAMAKAARAPG
jgi:hypothetical protein